MSEREPDPVAIASPLRVSPCGDPTCEVCVPPSIRCENCGALSWGEPVPYCSVECAEADAAAVN